MNKTMKTLVLALAGWMMFCASAFADKLYTGNFEKQMTIKASGYEGGTTLENFPVLVRLAEKSDAATLAETDDTTATEPTEPTEPAVPTFEIDGFSYADANKDEIRFTDANGELIPHEVDVWDPNGTSLVWVKLPRLDATNETTSTSFTMYYKAKNSEILPEVNSRDVWNSSYFMVYHMNNEVVEYGTATNAAQDAYHGKFQKSSKLGSTASVTDLGPVGNVYSTAARERYFTISESPLCGVYSFSGWVKVSSRNSGTDMIIQHGGGTGSPGFYCYASNDSQLGTRVNSDSISKESVYANLGQPIFDRWLYFSGTVEGTPGASEGSTRRFYVNGVRYVNDTVTQPTSPTYTCQIGYIHGQIDEIRFSSQIAHSADWVKAEYQTMAKAAFLTVERVEDVEVDTSTQFADKGAEWSDEGKVTVNGDLFAFGAGVSSVDVYVQYALQGSISSETVKAATLTSAPSEVAYELANLEVAKTYTYRFIAKNSATGEEVASTDEATFLVEAPTRLSNVEAKLENCRLTVTGTLDPIGKGAVKVTLLVGETEQSLGQFTATLTLTEEEAKAANGAFMLHVDSLVPGKEYMYKVQVENTYTATAGAETYETTNTDASSVASLGTISDQATYAWKGVEGDWTNPAMWESSDTGAFGYPTAGSIVEIRPQQDAVVVLDKSVTVAKMAFSTKDGGITFRGKGNVLRSLTATGGLSMDGYQRTEKTAYAKPLVFEFIEIPSSARLTNIDRVSKLVITKYSRIRMDDAPVFGDLHLNAFSSLHNKELDAENKKIQADTLVAGSGYNLLRSAAKFGSYRSLGQFGTIIVRKNQVEFEDIGGITLIGGDGSTAAKTPITTQFNVLETDVDKIDKTDVSKDGPSVRYPCTIVDKFVTTLSHDDFHSGFDGADERTNVKISGHVDLTADTTVNALHLNGVLNLGGNTLTLKSGYVHYTDGNGFDAMFAVTNGTLVLAEPSFVYCRVSMSTRGVHCALSSGANAEPTKPVVAFSNFNAFHNSDAAAVARFENLVGLVRFQGSENMSRSGANHTRLPTTKAPGVIFDLDGPCYTAGTAYGYSLIGTFGLMDDDGDGIYSAHFSGLGGDGYVLNSTTEFSSQKGSIWLGENEKNETIAPRELIVGKNGYLIPGAIDCRGESTRGSNEWLSPRDGGMRFGAVPSTIRAAVGYTNLIFKAGSKFCVTVRENGECTYVETKSWSGNNTLVTLEPGAEIVVTKAGKFTPPKGTAYPIIRAHKAITVDRDKLTLPPGWKAELIDDDKTLTLVSSPLGSTIIVR